MQAAEFPEGPAMSSIEALHDRAAALGLRPTRVNGHGFRCSCPICGGNQTGSISPGAVHAAVTFCHRCGAGVELLRALGGNGTRLSPSERIARERDRNVEAAAACAALAGLGGLVRPFVEGDTPPALLWDAGRMPRAGMLGNKTAFIIEDAAGTTIGIDTYCMPGSLERELAEAAGRPKLQAAVGSVRGMWPRPKDVPPSAIASEILFLVEGAPAAATVLGVGFACSAFPNGAGLRPHEVGRVLASLRGRAAIVLADADEVGRAGAARSARLLCDRGADSKALDLFPHRTDGYDVADELRHHGLASAAGWLLDRVAKAP
jgi:hypothetical protein